MSASGRGDSIMGRVGTAISCTRCAKDDIAIVACCFGTLENAGIKKEIFAELRIVMKSIDRIDTIVRQLIPRGEGKQQAGQEETI